jgi:hypothetical protein
VNRRAYSVLMVACAVALYLELGELSVRSLRATLPALGLGELVGMLP